MWKLAFSQVFDVEILLGTFGSLTAESIWTDCCIVPRNVYHVWIYIFTKYFLHSVGNFIGLVIHWLQVQSVASKIVILQISHHTVKITLCCFLLHVYHIRTCFNWELQNWMQFFYIFC